MNTNQNDLINDQITFLDEEQDLDVNASSKIWKLLIVDDDPQVHKTTDFALSGLQILERTLQLQHAYSATEAKELLRQQKDFAVVLLDVVMETENAGLQLASFIREELQQKNIRLILRTGQPGYAPDVEVVSNYDINDYKTKSELTRNRLVTTLTTALRSYEQLETIVHNRKGLEQLVRSATSVMRTRNLKSFSQSVLVQLESLLNQDLDAFICIQQNNSSKQIYPEQVQITGTCGSFQDFHKFSLQELPSQSVIWSVKQCLENKADAFLSNQVCLYFETSERKAVIYLELGQELLELERQLLKVFATNIAASFENVTLFEKVHYAAYFDQLTQLPNRSKFIELLEQAKMQQEPWQAALIDLEQFSEINDGLGQNVGDCLLQAVSKRLQSHLTDECSITRIGGDVFGLLGPSENIQPSDVATVFTEPFRVNEHLLPVSITMGLCPGEKADLSGFNTLKKLNISLNRAKKKPRTKVEHYSIKLEEETEERLRILNQLRKAFNQRKLSVYYQPQFDLLNNQMVGVEALLRWKTDDGKHIPPDIFVPLAESSGLIVEIGNWVLDEACSQLQKIHKEGYRQIVASINVSVPQFRKDGFVKHVHKTLEKYGLEPHHIKLEITENVVMDEPELVIKSLKRLKRLGVQVSLDDFGTGFSSLSYLQKLPVDQIKLDRAFVKDICSFKGSIIAKSVIELGQQLGLSTIGEGVETEEQADILRKFGCNEAQGYLYARAIVPNALMRMLRKESLSNLPQIITQNEKNKAKE